MGLKPIDEKYSPIIEEMVKEMKEQGISGWGFTHIDGWKFDIKTLAKSTRKKQKLGEFREESNDK